MPFPDVSEMHTDCAEFMAELLTITNQCAPTACVVVLFKGHQSKSFQFNIEHETQWIQALHNITSHYYLGVDVN